MSEEWSSAHLRLAVEAACVALWRWNVDTDAFAMDPRGFELWGLAQAEGVQFEELSSRIHPTDRDRVRAAFIATRSVVGSFEIDFRIIIDDDIRWISARGQGSDGASVDRTMFGVFLDVTGRKQAEEGSELLAGEMSHRVKNLLAIATSLSTFSARTATTVEEMNQQLTQRLTALGRAHDLVRPLPGEQGKAALLGDLLSILLAPYDDQGAFSGRVRVAVPRMGVGERTATSLAMVIHELATNTAKHGALSSDAGSLDITGKADDEMMMLTWAETGGPELTEEPTLSGFGSRMMRRHLEGQLGGSIRYDWQPTGLVAEIALKTSVLAS